MAGEDLFQNQRAPWLTVDETASGSVTTPPDAGDSRLFVDSADGLLKLKDSAGSVTTVGGSADHGSLTGLSDDDHTQYPLKSIATTKGDLWVATGAGVLVRLGVGTNDHVLTADSGEATGMKWAVGGGGGGGSTAGADLYLYHHYT